jgi:hypothetical protein
MRRIAALVAVSLSTALLVAMLTVGVVGAASSHSADEGDHTFSAALTPDLGPTVEPTIANIKPGGQPWVLTSGHATLSQNGRLEVSVEGLLFAPNAADGLPGTTGPIKMVVASVVCANGPVVVTSDAVPFAPDGDAHIHQRVSLPDQCVGPIVLIQANGAAGPWLAATGL